MTTLTKFNRRDLILAALSMGATGTVPVWAQGPSGTSGSRAHTVAQIVDMSASQIDVSKDFLVGSRAAWKDINAKGGLRGGSVRHLVLEVDGSAASIKAALDTLKSQQQCLALFGTAGDHAASQVATILRKEMPDMAHIAPWLQSMDMDAGENTFPIFAPRVDQIAHAIKTLSVMGIPSLGAIYGSQAEFSAYRDSMEQIAAKLKVRITSYSPSADLKLLGSTLSPDSPRILIFLGGTPELVQFSQGIDKQAAQRYIVAMSDVNLQTMAQMGASKFASVVATQVVPLVNSNLPIVKTYREALGRLYDEPPTPQSLAGFMSARYTFEMLQSVDGGLSRASTLQALQKRGSIDLGGFRVALDSKSRSGTYVTQSMLSSDGRLVG